MLSNSYLRLIILGIFLLASTNVFAKETLVFAIDLIRHGDRTPIYQVPKSPCFWQEGLGGLTAKGIDQEVQLGKQLRKEYVDQHHLLPRYYNSSNLLYVYSTNKQRTIKSAESSLIGLYPLQDRAFAAKVPIHILSPGEEDLLIVKPNKNIVSLIKLYLIKSRIWKEKTTDLQEKLKKWREETGSPLDSIDQLDDLADNLYIRKIKGIALPNGISENEAKEIICLAESAIVNKFKLKDFSKPTGQRVLKLVAHYCKLVIQNNTELKYILLSGHDSSIMSVMTTLNAPLEKIPGYASRLNFSLFANKHQYYIKIFLNNKPVNIPGCEKNICTLSQFYKLAKE